MYLYELACTVYNKFNRIILIIYSVSQSIEVHTKPHHATCTSRNPNAAVAPQPLSDILEKGDKVELYWSEVIDVL